MAFHLMMLIGLPTSIISLMIITTCCWCRNVSVFPALSSEAPFLVDGEVTASSKASKMPYWTHKHLDRLSSRNQTAAADDDDCLSIDGGGGGGFRRRMKFEGRTGHIRTLLWHWSSGSGTIDGANYPARTNQSSSAKNGTMLSNRTSVYLVNSNNAKFGQEQQQHRQQNHIRKIADRKESVAKVANSKPLPYHLHHHFSNVSNETLRNSSPTPPVNTLQKMEAEKRPQQMSREAAGAPAIAPHSPGTSNGANEESKARKQQKQKERKDKKLGKKNGGRKRGGKLMLLRRIFITGNGNYSRKAMTPVAPQLLNGTSVLQRHNDQNGTSADGQEHSRDYPRTTSSPCNNNGQYKNNTSSNQQQQQTVANKECRRRCAECRCCPSADKGDCFPATARSTFVTEIIVDNEHRRR